MNSWHLLDFFIIVVVVVITIIPAVGIILFSE